MRLYREDVGDGRSGKTTAGLSLRPLFLSIGKPEVNSEFLYTTLREVGTLVTGV